MPLIPILLMLACKEEEDPCGIVQAEWEAELAAVQACEVDEDCGLPIPGTADDLFCQAVQANDADPAQLYYLLQLGDDLGCSLVDPVDGTCPKATGYRCDDGVCAWDTDGGGAGDSGS